MCSRLKYYLKLEKAYFRLGIYTFIEYPLDSLIWMVSMIIREAVGFLGIVIIIDKLGDIGNWNIYELCLMFALSMIPESLGQILFDSVWNIGGYVRKGVFDNFLVKPASILFQLHGQRFNFQAVITLIAAAILYFYSWMNIQVFLAIDKILFLFEFVVFGTILNSCIYLLFNCLNFWFVQSDDVAEVVQIFRQFAKYPLLIFPKIISICLTYIVPFGFISYYPACYILEKIDTNIPILLLIVTVIVFIITIGVWHMGIKGYNSTGT